MGLLRNVIYYQGALTRYTEYTILPYDITLAQYRLLPRGYCSKYAITTGLLLNLRCKHEALTQYTLLPWGLLLNIRYDREFLTQYTV